MSELELEVAKKRVGWLEGEVDRMKIGIDGDGEERERGGVERENIRGWGEMEKRVEKCVRRVLREERGITADLNREVGRIEERVNRAERYMWEEVREELDRSVRATRGNTVRVKETGKRKRDKGGEMSVGDGGGERHGRGDACAASPGDHRGQGGPRRFIREGP